MAQLPPNQPPGGPPPPPQPGWGGPPGQAPPPAWGPGGPPGESGPNTALWIVVAVLGIAVLILGIVVVSRDDGGDGADTDDAVAAGDASDESSRDAGSPEDVAQRYIEALVDGDCDTVRELAVGYMRDCDEYGLPGNRVVSASAGEPDDGEVVVEVEMRTDDGDTEQVNLELNLVDETWVVADIDYQESDDYY